MKGVLGHGGVFWAPLAPLRVGGVSDIPTGGRLADGYVVTVLRPGAGRDHFCHKT